MENMFLPKGVKVAEGGDFKGTMQNLYRLNKIYGLDHSQFPGCGMLL